MGKKDKKPTMTEASHKEGRSPNVILTQDQIDDMQDEAGGEENPPPPENMTTTEGKDGLPDWVKVPKDLEIPVGYPVGILLFKAAWTMTPRKGDRHCIVWPLTALDERVAYARIRDNFGHAQNELSKQMLRSIDGVKCNWTAGRDALGNIDDFLDDIGPKCRGLLARWYMKTHQLDSTEVAYFLDNCAHVRTMD